MSAHQTANRTAGWEIQVVLAITALAVTLPLLYSLAMLLGPNGLRIFTPPGNAPIIGTASVVPHLEATLSKASVTVSPLPQDRWVESEDGTKDREGKLLAELNGPYRGDISLWGVTDEIWPRLAWMATRLATPLMIALGAYWLFQIVSSVRRGHPFTAANARRLTWLAALVMIGGTLVQWVTQLVEVWLLQASGAADIVAVEGTFSFAPLGIGLVLAILAQVWRRGVQLEEDVEGLV